MINWIKKKLGIYDLDGRVDRLEELEHFTLADMVDRLKESMVVVAADEQLLDNTHITIPANKSGVLVLGKNAIIRNCRLEQQKIRTIIEPIED